MIHIPSPADFHLSTGDLHLLVGHCGGNWRRATGILIERFHITEKVAQAWLEALKQTPVESESAR